MTLHPAMLAMIEARQAAGLPGFRDLGVSGARQMSDATQALLQPGPEMAAVRDLTMNARSGPMALRLFLPNTQPAGLLLFFHGGGWVLGSIESYDPVCRRLAAAAGCAILSVDYRLAPETVFPGAAEDCYDALCWAAENMEALVGSAVPLGVSGDSAGGNLAAVAALLARNRDGPALALQCLIFPVTDCNFERPSYHRHADDGLLTAEAMHWFWDQYVPDTAQRTDPLVSPLRAESLAGLPPALLELAGHDPLLDEGQAYGERLAASGVSTEIHCHEALCHGFFQLESLLPPAADAVDEIAARVRRLLSR